MKYHLPLVYTHDDVLCMYWRCAWLYLFPSGSTGARIEEFFYEKLDKKVPSRVTNGELLGQYMLEASRDFGPETPYGQCSPCLRRCLIRLEPRLPFNTHFWSPSDRSNHSTLDTLGKGNTNVPTPAGVSYSMCSFHINSLISYFFLMCNIPALE